MSSVTSVSAAARMDGTGNDRASGNHWRAKTVRPTAARISDQDPGAFSASIESPNGSKTDVGRARSNSCSRKGRFSGALRMRCMEESLPEKRTAVARGVRRRRSETKNDYWVFRKACKSARS